MTVRPVFFLTEGVDIQKLKPFMISALCLMLADQMIKVKISSAYMQSVICCNWTSVQQRDISERVCIFLLL